MKNLQFKDIEIIESDSIKIIAQKHRLSIIDYALILTGLFFWGQFLYDLFSNTFIQQKSELTFYLIFLSLFSLMICIPLFDSQIIIIRDDDIEIRKKRLLLTIKYKLDRQNIKKVDLVDVMLSNSPLITFYSILHFFNYKIPRISDGKTHIYLFEFYSKSARLWIFEYLTEKLTKN